MRTHQTATAEVHHAASSCPEELPHKTESVRMTDVRTMHFIAATEDDQLVHTDDASARSLQLPMRIMHGALIRDIAVNTLVLRALCCLLGTTETHMVIDLGGDYLPYGPVYPSEHIYVRYKYEGRARPRGTFPIQVSYAVFVQRNDQEIKVLEGSQRAQVTFLRKS